jgi:predicted dithiol-disulfide oxidoreductase (DUF899 family)
MTASRLTESDEYVAHRQKLRNAEVSLIHQREEVAALRRDGPGGPVLEDYVFQEGPRDLDDGDAAVTDVRLSELFTSSDRSLIIYQLMFGKAQESPCPMCTMWVDGFNGVARGVAQKVDFAVVAAADLPELREHARNRGWNGFRLLSAGNNSFKYDLGSENENGEQASMVSVFTLDREGRPRLFYSGTPDPEEGIFERGIDLLCPTWHMLDLTPEGRDDWYPSLSS